MSVDNPLWTAPRIHGELLKLGIEVAQSSVAKYMFRRGGSPSAGGSSFCATIHRTSPPIDLLVVLTQHSRCARGMDCTSDYGGVFLE
jgi:hypothetical protein